MEQTITFRVKQEDKEKIRQVADKLGLSMGSYCRTIVLTKIREGENQNG